MESRGSQQTPTTPRETAVFLDPCACHKPIPKSGSKCHAYRYTTSRSLVLPLDGNGHRHSVGGNRGSVQGAALTDFS